MWWTERHPFVWQDQADSLKSLAQDDPQRYCELTEKWLPRIQREPRRFSFTHPELDFMGTIDWTNPDDPDWTPARDEEGHLYDEDDDEPGEDMMDEG
mmetsp:Transcript_12859/g.30680  ORF Transcript_12859/g.30680 Transcript_12859/m.30680 type:complete len:97 (+) Transcript_12859:251-541(+)